MANTNSITRVELLAICAAVAKGEKPVDALTAIPDAADILERLAKSITPKGRAAGEKTDAEKRYEQMLPSLVAYLTKQVEPKTSREIFDAGAVRGITTANAMTKLLAYGAKVGAVQVHAHTTASGKAKPNTYSLAE